MRLRPAGRQRRAAGRRALLLAVVVALVGTLAGTVPGAQRAAAATGDTPFVHTPAPMPGEVLDAGEVTVSAWAWSAEPVAAVELTVDGAPVSTETGAHREGWGRQVRATVELAPGAHRARLRFQDTAGQHAERAWSFTTTDVAVERLAGDGRVDTSVAVSQATFPTAGSVDAAFVARADDFADGLAGVPLATAEEAPLLLSHRDSLPPTVADELDRVLAADGTVHLLGGEEALEAPVADAVTDLGFAVRRHAGPDRYATAATVADRLPTASEAMLVSGTSFADALAVSAPAARDGVPIVLTARDHLPDATAEVLRARGVTTVTIVGGTTAVSDAVEHEVRELVGATRRVAGADRYATAAAVHEHFYTDPAAVSLASGVTFPDALSGARHAAAHGQPLLLTTPETLAPPAAEALGDGEPDRLDVYGGPTAVTGHVADAAVRAVVDGPDAPRVTGLAPTPATTVPYLDALTVTFDRAVDPTRSTVHLTVGGREVAGRIVETGPTSRLTWRLPDGEPARTLDVAHAGRVTVRTRDADGGTTAHAATDFTYLEPDPLFATAGGVQLHLPSRHVEMIGFHESNHDGAQQQQSRDTATPTTTLPSRHRGNGSRTAADVVAAPDLPVLAPVSGEVKRAGSYVLYCDYTDHYLVIDPDDRPGWEVKMLHFRGLRVDAGDRVVAGQTVVGTGPRPLPFESQVDEYSAERDWPHLHLEVVDPSIPDRPSGGC